VIALNKVDRIYGWKPNPGIPIEDNIASQEKSVISDFMERLKNITFEFSSQGLNVLPFWQNKDFHKNLCIVPTSAITGEGVQDLLLLLLLLSQKYLCKTLKKLNTLQVNMFLSIN
jgi:translation initiation factor 5B